MGSAPCSYHAQQNRVVLIIPDCTRREGAFGFFDSFCSVVAVFLKEHLNMAEHHFPAEYLNEFSSMINRYLALTELSPLFH